MEAEIMCFYFLNIFLGLGSGNVLHSLSTLFCQNLLEVGKVFIYNKVLDQDDRRKSLKNEIKPQTSYFPLRCE